MGQLSLSEVIIIFLIVVPFVWPAARICRRLGLSQWLGILIAVPLANLILLWFIAFAEWPNLPRSHRRRYLVSLVWRASSSRVTPSFTTALPFGPFAQRPSWLFLAVPPR